MVRSFLVEIIGQLSVSIVHATFKLGCQLADNDQGRNREMLLDLNTYGNFSSGLTAGEWNGRLPT